MFVLLGIAVLALLSGLFPWLGVVATTLLAVCGYNCFAGGGRLGDGFIGIFCGLGAFVCLVGTIIGFVIA